MKTELGRHKFEISDESAQGMVATLSLVVIAAFFGGSFFLAKRIVETRSLRNAAQVTQGRPVVVPIFAEDVEIPEAARAPVPLPMDIAARSQAITGARTSVSVP